MYITAAAAEPQINSIKNQIQQKLVFGLFQAFIKFLSITQVEQKIFVLFSPSNITILNQKLLSTGQYIFAFDKGTGAAKLGLILPIELIENQGINTEIVKKAVLGFITMIRIPPPEPK